MYYAKYIKIYGRHFFLIDDYNKTIKLLDKYFLYCKWKYHIDKNGKVICIPHNIGKEENLGRCVNLF